MSGALKKSNPIRPEQELSVLSDISNTVQESQANNESLEKMLKQLGKIVDYRSASIYFLSKERNRLEEVCSVGRKVDLIDFVSFEMGNGISAWVAKHKRPILLNNLRKSRGGTHTKSFLSVPMLFGKEVVGVINLAHDEPDSFTRRDAEIVAVVASMLVLIVERDCHRKAVSAVNEEIEKMTLEIRSMKEKLTAAEKLQSAGDLAATLNQRINNPLAIISGNAQFLLMTMKNSSSSVLKRLKAIDKEASNILHITEKLCDSTYAYNQHFPLNLGEEN